MATGKPEWKKLVEKSRPRTRTVRLCLDGELQEALAEAKAVPSNSLGGNQAARELEQQIEEASIDFKLRGLSRATLRKLEADHPTDDEESAWDADTFPEALVRACLVEPEVAPEDELFEVLTAGEADRLFEAAFLACNEADPVPLQKRG